MIIMSINSYLLIASNSQYYKSNISYEALQIFYSLEEGFHPEESILIIS
jgi:hypothetical protein